MITKCGRMGCEAEVIGMEDEKSIDSYYGDQDGPDEDLDLSFLDEDDDEKGLERGDS